MLGLLVVVVRQSPADVLFDCSDEEEVLLHNQSEVL